MLPLRPAILLLIVFFSSSASSVDVATLEKSVVRIFARGTTGSGSVVANKIVLTNQHVVDGARDVQVISEHTGSRLDAQVLWESSDLDLAVLRVDGLNLPVVTLATRQPNKGDEVWAFGYPVVSDYRRVWSKKSMKFNLEATVTRGVISNFHQESWLGGRGGSDLSIIQHDAPINPGNSGGPLFDGCGRVVGVNTRYRNDAQGTYFASRIIEAIPNLERISASLQKSDDPCIPSSGGVVGLDEFARRQAEAAQQQAGTAQQEAEEAQQEAEEAQQEAEEAQQVAGTALQVAGTAGQKAESAQLAAEAATQQATKAGYISLVTGLGGGLLALAAIALALRRPRRQIIQGVEHIVQLSRRYLPSYSAAGKGRVPPVGPAPKGRTVLVLAGFDTNGRKMRILVPEQAYRRHRAVM